jgi:hypothetical protein
MFSPRGVFRIVGGVPFRRDDALHLVIVRGLGALSHQTFGFVVSVVPRLSTSALCVIGGPTFGSSTFGGNQRGPGHLDPVALLHEQRLRERTTVA